MAVYAYILGRDPELSVWEFVSYCENKGVKYTVMDKTESYVICEIPRCDPARMIEHLGGVQKIAKQIDNIENISVTTNTIRYAVSAVKGDKSKVEKDLKLFFKKEKIKAMRRYGSSKEITPTQSLHLDIELITWKNKIFQVVAASKPKEYKRRDVKRPAFDPLKTMSIRLAKILINIAKPKTQVLDPFCGIGTIIQESLLLGYSAIGTDIDISDAKKNIEWLDQKYKDKARLFECDIRRLKREIKSVECVVTEPYLGPYLKRKNSEKELKKTTRELESLYFRALQNLRRIVRKRVVIIFPSFYTARQKHIEPKVRSLIQKNGFIIIKKEGLSNPVRYQGTKNRIERFIYILERK